MTDTAIGILLAHGKEEPTELKIYRKWIAKNPRTHIPSDYCCLLLDKEEDAIQAMMDINEKNYFDELIHIGSAYRISNFVIQTTPAYLEPLNKTITLRFGRITTFAEIRADDFPKHYFRFVTYNQLESKLPKKINDTTTHYAAPSDYISILKNMDDPVDVGNASTFQTVRRSIYIENLSQNVVEITLWGDLATSFNKEAWKAMEQPVMLAISSCRESLAKYRYRERYLQQPYLDISRARNITDIQQPNHNRQPLQTLLRCNPRSYEGVTFTSQVTINSIHTYGSWYYKCCSQCSKKVREKDDTYSCINDGIQPNPNHMYCFNAIATDGTSNTTFTFFSPAGDKLVNLTCNQLVAIHPDPAEKPTQISSTVGQKYNIHFQYNPSSINTEFITSNVAKIETAVQQISATTEQGSQTKDNEHISPSNPDEPPTAPATPALPQHMTSQSKTPTSTSAGQSSDNTIQKELYTALKTQHITLAHI